MNKYQACTFAFLALSACVAVTTIHPVTSPSPDLTIKPTPVQVSCCQAAWNLSDGKSFKARGTGYYPDSSALEGGFKDRHGVPLRTLQSFLSGTGDYISTAMDSNAFPYGTKICIPELSAHYGKPLPFKVVDTGNAFKNKGATRIDVCVENNKASLDSVINGTLTLIQCL